MSSASQPVSKLSAAADNNRDCESLNDLISSIYVSIRPIGRALAQQLLVTSAASAAYSKKPAPVSRQADLVKLVTG
jgi:hypothetical protein